MAGGQRVGKAVLEFRTDTGTVFVDVSKMKAAMGDLQRTSKATGDGLDPLAKGMAAAGREASASAKMIAGMGAAGRTAIKDLDGTTKQLSLTQRAASSLRASWGQMAAGFAIGNLAVQAATGLVRVARAAVENAGALVDMNGKTGMSIEGLQRMGFVAKQVGSNVETFTQAAFMGQVNLAKGTDAVKRTVKDLGLSYEELRQMRPDQLFETILAALGRVQNEQDRNRMAVTLFGRAAKDVLPAIAEGYDQIAASANVASDAQIRAIDRYADRATQAYDNATTGLMAFIGQQFALQDAVAEVTEEFKRQGKALDQAQIMPEARRRMELNLVGRRKRTDIEFGAAGARGDAAGGPSFVAQLAAARTELGKLTAAQRAEILAAQQMQAEEEELAAILKRFGITSVDTSLAVSLLSAQQKAAAKTTDDITKKYPTLTAALAATNAAVANLTVSQRAEIDAGTKLGVSEENIAKKLRISEETVSAYNDQVKAAAAFQKQMTEELDRFIGTARKAAEEEAHLRGLLQASQALSEATAANIAGRNAADTQRKTSIQRAEFEAQMAERAGASWQMVAAMQQRAARMRLDDQIRLAEREYEIAVDGKDRNSDVYRQMTAEHNANVQQMVEAFQQGEALKRAELERTHDVWRQRFEQLQADIVGTVSDATADMLVGLRSWKDAFVDIWRGIRSAVANILSQMVNDFLTGYLKRLATNQLAGLLPGGGGGAGAGGGGGVGQLAQSAALNYGSKLLFGGGAATVAGTTSGTALLGGAVTAGGGGLLTSTSMAGSLAAPSTAGGSAVAGGAAGGGGMSAGFLTNPAFWTNPWTIGVAATAGLLTWGITKKGWFRGGEEGAQVNPRRDKFKGQLGGHDGMSARLTQALIRSGQPDAGNRASAMMRALDAAKKVKALHAAEDSIIAAFRASGVHNVKKYGQGGFIAPGVVQAAILHGGRRGEYVIPGDKLERAASGGPSVMTVNFQVSTADADSFDRIIDSKVIPRLKTAILLNRGGFTAAHRRALGLT